MLFLMFFERIFLVISIPENPDSNFESFVYRTMSFRDFLALEIAISFFKIMVFSENIRFLTI